MDEEINRVIKIQLLLCFILYSTSSMELSKQISKADLDAWTDKQYTKYTQTFLEALDSAGYKIVKKERSFEELMSQ